MKPGFSKTSRCGIASLIVTLPFILGVVFGLLVFLAASLKLVGSDTFYAIFMVGSIGFMFWFIVVLICSLSGAILAVVSLLRREKRPLLGVLGLILNGCPFILMIVVLFQHWLF
jgi:hypothetical protein